VLNLANGRGTEICMGLKFGKACHANTAVNEEIIRQLESLELTDKRLTLARAIFLFCFLAQGMPLIDAAHLEKSNIVNGFIIYHRHKTRMPVVVEITPMLKMLMGKIPPGHGKYLLPILDGSKDTERCFKNFSQRYNRWLHNISDLMGEQVHLTSYVSRHTWATTADSIGGEMDVISRGLGHSSTKVTAAYIDNITNKGVIQLNRNVIAHMLTYGVLWLKNYAIKKNIITLHLKQKLLLQ